MLNEHRKTRPSLIGVFIIIFVLSAQAQTGQKLVPTPHSGSDGEIVGGTLSDVLKAHPDFSIRIGYAADNAIWKDVSTDQAGDAYIAFSRKGHEFFRAPCGEYCEWPEGSGPKLKKKYRDIHRSLDIYLVSKRYKTKYGIGIGDSAGKLMSSVPRSQKSYVFKIESINYPSTEVICFFEEKHDLPKPDMWFYVQAPTWTKLVGRYEDDANHSSSIDPSSKIIAIRVNSPCRLDDQ